eukprot:CAMPEP_0206218714 /NCGR_PEP_ID=MMETSP0047_2-20121206/3941_1 /ASSEMBLY_ACC=CAM_ASM_000192 /TAXON_ID=195065 /ORGANISM="Chroomonas mesostigmatica_cf, Strain CCMP1168" /LENGTH=735 /DNA_ID=CAMNT_0053641225 /DNA_START=57 /DNA_END=2261 /DNA_ORIENTATION=+
MEMEVEGQLVHLETGEMGRLAAGSVVAKQGGSIVYSTACGDLWEDKEETVEDFVPLSVHYQERSSAAGKTSGGYIKRDGRPSDDEVLVSRLIDRTLRPLFPPGFCREVQILSWVLSYDPTHNVDPLALLSSSAALLGSAIPFDAPISGVCVGMDPETEKFVVNPNRELLKKSRLNLFLSGTETSVMMIEGSADFLTEEQMEDAIEAGMEVIAAQCRGLRLFADKVLEMRKLTSKTHLVRKPNEGLYEEMMERFGGEMDKAIRTGSKLKGEVYTAFDVVEKQVKAHFLAGDRDTWPKGLDVDVKTTFKRMASEKMRLMAIESDLRVDGRSTREVRPIEISVPYLPPEFVHGSAIFTRGETQALATATLGDKGSRQRTETLDGEQSKRFYLQYVFPPSSVGECGRVGTPGRREIGHGNLAERGLRAVIPSEEEFPYTIRVESLITESCGSSSMASVCGGTLAMLDAGVPLKRAVAGVAMGLFLPYENKKGADSTMDDEAVILTDILGIEDGLGTMDFKITGDAKGITAFQLDIKCEGLSISLLKRALSQAKEGRLHILYHMLKAKPTHSEKLSPAVPKMLTLTVPQSAIGKIIGPGGSMIRGLIEEFGLTNMDIEETPTQGIVVISSLSEESNAKCAEKVQFLVDESNNFSPGGKGTGTGTRRERAPDPEVGAIYKDCEVVGVHPFGCFVQLYQGKEGLVHVSELDVARINNVEEAFKIGDKMDVKVVALKDQKGKL